MRFLAFSDIHGNVNAVRRLISEVSPEEFDFILFSGDFTNAWFDGLEKGQQQMNEIAPLLQSLDIPSIMYMAIEIMHLQKGGSNVPSEKTSVNETGV